MAVEGSTKLDVKYVPLKELKVTPDNRKKHPPEQISRLMKLIAFQGFRVPIIVSNLSGKIVSGHCRLSAAKKMKLTHVPVIYQDFKDEDQERSFLISENAISEWGMLDFSGINEDVATFDGAEFDLEHLGIQNFTLDRSDKPEAEEDTKTKTLRFIECPNCKEEFEYKQGKKRNG